MALSIFERAKLRLMAWYMLDGWGKQANSEKNEWRPFDMEQRREAALNLVEWAMEDDEPAA